MKSKEIIRRIQNIIADTSVSLNDRIGNIFELREDEEWDNEVDIECYKMMIAAIKEENAIATNVEDLLFAYVLLAGAYVRAKVFRPLEQLSVDVRALLRDERIAWELIEEAVPNIIDALDDSVYHHETYRLLLTFLAIAFRNGKLNSELKGRVRHLLKLQLLLDDIYRWHDHLLTNEMQAAIASLFTREELLKIILNPTIGRLKCDPVEYTCKWEEIYYDVEEYLSERFANAPRQRGFCFMYWSVKQDYLKENYNIEWHSPAQMNPHVRFD